MTNSNPSTVRLLESERDGLITHFLALGPEDRRLRFGSTLADDGIRAYVARIDFGRDGLFAVQDDALRLLAVVHIATTGNIAELGLSVVPRSRGQGLGNALFRRAVTFLRNRGGVEVFVHCLSENAAMMHLARKNGMRIVYSGVESDARLALAPATAQSYITEWLDDQQGRDIRIIRQIAHATRLMFAMPAR